MYNEPNSSEVGGALVKSATPLPADSLNGRRVPKLLVNCAMRILAVLEKPGGGDREGPSPPGPIKGTNPA